MSQPHDLQERLAHNEAGYRRLNEGIERGHADDPPSRQVGFRCECARLGCNAIVLLSKAEYEAFEATPGGSSCSTATRCPISKTS